jgi:hypothetical protein
MSATNMRIAITSTKSAALGRFPNPPENLSHDAPTPVPLNRNRFVVAIFGLKKP